MSIIKILIITSLLGFISKKQQPEKISDTQNIENLNYDFHAFLENFETIKLPFDSEKLKPNDQFLKNTNSNYRSIGQYVDPQSAFSRSLPPTYIPIGKFELDENVVAVIVRKKAWSTQNKSEVMFFCFNDNGEKLNPFESNNILAVSNDYQKQSFHIGEDGLILINTAAKTLLNKSLAAKKIEPGYDHFIITKNFELQQIKHGKESNFYDFADLFEPRDLPYNFDASGLNQPKKEWSKFASFLDKSQDLYKRYSLNNSRSTIKKFLPQKSRKFSRISPPQIIPVSKFDLDEQLVAFVFSKSYYLQDDPHCTYFLAVFDKKGQSINITRSDKAKSYTMLPINEIEHNEKAVFQIDASGLVTVETEVGKKQFNLGFASQSASPFSKNKIIKKQISRA